MKKTLWVGVYVSSYVFFIVMAILSLLVFLLATEGPPGHAAIAGLHRDCNTHPRSNLTIGISGCGNCL